MRCPTRNSNKIWWLEEEKKRVRWDREEGRKERTKERTKEKKKRKNEENGGGAYASRGRVFLILGIPLSRGHSMAMELAPTLGLVISTQIVQY